MARHLQRDGSGHLMKRGVADDHLANGCGECDCDVFDLTDCSGTTVTVSVPWQSGRVLTYQVDSTSTSVHWALSDATGGYDFYITCETDGNYTAQLNVTKYGPGTGPICEWQQAVNCGTLLTYDGGTDEWVFGGMTITFTSADLTSSTGNDLLGIYCEDDDATAAVAEVRSPA